MLSIPAFCDTCGTAFPSGIILRDVTNAQLWGNKSGPCPRCGGWGHVPDGIFNFVGSTIEILSAPHRTIHELNLLLGIIREATTQQQSSEQVKQEIKQKLSGLSLLANLLPENKQELYNFLALMAAAVQLLTWAPQPPQNVTININQVLEQTLKNTERATQQARNAPSKTVGRDESCKCGSGKKYKKCCGAAT